MNKAEAAAWANHFIHEEQADTEQFSPVLESGDSTERKCPRSRMTVCVLVLPLASLRISSLLILFGVGIIENARKALQSCT